MPTRLKAAFADDSGIVLPVILGVIGIITVVAIGGFTMANQALHDAGRHDENSVAYQVASSGMDRTLAGFAGLVAASPATGEFSVIDGGATPDGTYEYTITRPNSAFSYLYSITCTGTAGGSRAVLSQRFFYLDTWGMNVSGGSTGDFAAGASWNGNSSIHGPMYVDAPSPAHIDLNSNATLEGGPLFIHGATIDFQTGAAASRLTPSPDSEYYIFADEPYVPGGVTALDEKADYVGACPAVDMKPITDQYFTIARKQAQTESRDNKFGYNRNPTSPPADLEEVAEDGTTYLYTPYSPGQSHYKVVNGPLNLTGNTPTFGATNDPLHPYGDFGYDGVNDILYVNGVVYVDGDITVGNGVKGYRGKGMLVTKGEIDILPGSGLKPPDYNGGGSANDITSEDCLGLVAEGDVSITGTTFEGVVVSDSRLVLEKSGGNPGVFMGSVHAREVYAVTPQTEIWMEQGFGMTMVPEGMPGTPTDFRGAGYVNSGMYVVRTWTRK